MESEVTLSETPTAFSVNGSSEVDVYITRVDRAVSYNITNIATSESIVVTEGNIDNADTIKVR